MPHNQETVHETENGIVLHCKGCNELQLRFGNIVLFFNYEQFSTFKDSIDSIDLDDNQADMPEENRRYMLKTAHNIGFRLTVKEIHELRHLLDVTNATLNMYMLVQQTLSDN